MVTSLYPVYIHVSHPDSLDVATGISKKNPDTATVSVPDQRRVPIAEQSLWSRASRIRRRHKSSQTAVPTRALPAVSTRCAAEQVTGSHSAYTAAEVLAAARRGSFV